jgi:hypothetical protein
LSIELDSPGLTSAAAQLAGIASAPSAATAQPPGLDMTSVSAVMQLNAAASALSALLVHGSQVREVGAQAVTNTAAFLTEQDATNAGAISNGSSPGEPAPPPAIPNIASPSVPTVPSVPGALVPLPGEQHAQALYGGPGSSSLHQFASQWESTAAQLRDAAQTVTQAGHAMDASWNDGKQRAGANTRRHGEWVEQMAEHANKLADHARTVAGDFDTAKNSTPSPHEFEQAKQELHAALARFQSSRGANAAEVQQKSQQLAQMQTQATAAATNYHSAVTTSTLTSSVESMKLAPPIAGGSAADTPDVQAAGWKQGDKRHFPIIRGPGGLGPAQPADGPGWVELGPGSGNFVRADELPGLQIKEPGALGPAPGYIELGPGSGAWVPKSDFPHAQFETPGSLGPWGYEEYLPGTGIWLPRADIVPDPADPAPPSGAVHPA